MDEHSQQVVDGPVKYLHWGYRLLIAALVALLINAEGQHKPFLVLVKQLNYWIAVVFSFLFAVLLIWMVHWLTKRMDVRLPWPSALLWRLVWQFLLGVCMVVYLNYLLVKLYFWFFEMDFAQSGYMRVEFPIVKWMVLFMNVLYIAWFYAASFRRSSTRNQELNSALYGFYDIRERQQDYQRSIEAKLGNKVVMISPLEVACFEREENVGYVWMIDGRKYNIDLKMQELAEILDPGLFYQISRSVMISMNAVRGYEKVKNKQGELILKEGVEVGVSLLVSRFRFDGFKKVLERSRNLQ